MRTVYDQNGLETKKLLNKGLGWKMIVNINTPVDSVGTLSVLKENVLHELKLRYLNVRFT